jgi:hypothetical protein
MNKYLTIATNLDSLKSDYFNINLQNKEAASKLQSILMIKDEGFEPPTLQNRVRAKSRRFGINSESGSFCFVFLRFLP